MSASYTKILHVFFKRWRVSAPIAVIMFSIPLVIFIANSQAKQNIPTPSPSIVVANKPAQSYGVPVRLKIPSIQVDTVIEQVGLTPSGDMAVPKGQYNVGWYNQGPHPGQIGSAVIDGHFGWWKDGTPTVFINLNKLHKGDRLYITDNANKVTTFVVSKLQIYSPNENGAQVFGSNDEQSHLNLITCEGIWNQANQTYSSRLVVFTNKVTP